LEEQGLWKNIAMLTKELRYKLEQYRKEKTNEGIFSTGYYIGHASNSR